MTPLADTIYALCAHAGWGSVNFCFVPRLTIIYLHAAIEYNFIPEVPEAQSEI